MNCDQARTELIAYLKGELEKEERTRLESHLARCPNCRHEMEGARRLLSWTEAASQEAVAKKLEEIIDGVFSAPISDIHFEPQSDDSLLVRYRIDGVLHEAGRIDSVQRYGVITRIKMLADLSVAETDAPQDGRFNWTFNERTLDLRVSCIPFVFGEGIVIRILDKSGRFLKLEDVYLYEDDLRMLEHWIGQPTGMIVVAGPTGSGKTTLCYSMLLRLTHAQNKVVTVENPVEMQIPGVNHIQVRSPGLTSPKAIRALLRHDPDIMYVGDVQDTETATLCAHAALTGHLVIVSLHASSAVEAIRRLVDIGTDPYLIGETLTGVTNQRLVRRPCAQCKEEAEVDFGAPAIKYLGITPDDLADHKILRGKGCDNCRNTGYRGRAAIYELLEMDRELGAKIADGATPIEILEAARAKGFRTMIEDAKRKVLDGLTTPEEAVRVLAASV